ncbi:DUF6193 family natural product biosynthesis protein [Streptomyces sp. SID13666]|uniref:DUF6193 family natural product biosynthesis protein n=1 Tax=Streptomyces sp. SID13666 TaxID=2706054 RepID=UPI0023B29AD8|nr:DUF6193 family natural product biosynthesis protein [Streptomyces sp. SID13666]
MRPRHRQSGQAGGRPHAAASTNSIAGFPWSQDLPSIFPLDGERFHVLRLHEPQGSGRERIGGAFTAQEAVEIAAAHLPAGWGPAVDGKPDILEPLS